MNREKSTWSRILSWLPSIIIAAGIFWFSSQTADASTQTSDWLVFRIREFIQRLGFIHIPPEYEMAVYDFLSVLVRKTAHATEYALLAVSIVMALRYNHHEGADQCRLYRLAWFTTVLYAGTDEFHQLFVPGRAGLMTDMMIDAAGAAAGLMVTHLLQKFFRTGKRQV